MKLGSGSYAKIILIKEDGHEFAQKKYFKIEHGWIKSAFREIVSMSSLQPHNNILHLLSFDRSLNLKFPRMEQNLRQYLKNTTVSDTLIIKWCSQLFSAVFHIHQAFFVHRDIKLENILLKDSNIFLADFGLARKFQTILTPVTQTTGAAHSNESGLFFANQNVPSASQNVEIQNIEGQASGGQDFDASEKFEMSGNVCSLWTKPPEVLKRNENKFLACYNSKLDCWGVGCVMLAFVYGNYVFRGKNAGEVLESICEFEERGGVAECKAHCLRVKLDLPSEYFLCMSLLLHHDPEKRAGLDDVLKIWACKNLPISMAAAVSEKETELFQSLGEDVELSNYSKNIALWMKNILKTLGLNPTTAYYAFLCWICYPLPKDKELLFSAACCSLLCKVNDHQDVQYNVWAKACNSKVSILSECELDVLIYFKGKLYLETLNKKIRNIFFMNTF